MFLIIDYLFQFASLLPIDLGSGLSCLLAATDLFCALIISIRNHLVQNTITHELVSY